MSGRKIWIMTRLSARVDAMPGVSFSLFVVEEMLLQFLLIPLEAICYTCYITSPLNPLNWQLSPLSSTHFWIITHLAHLYVSMNNHEIQPALVLRFLVSVFAFFNNNFNNSSTSLLNIFFVPEARLPNLCLHGSGLVTVKCN